MFRVVLCVRFKDWNFVQKLRVCAGICRDFFLWKNEEKVGNQLRVGRGVKGEVKM